jgi:hypothetical protein
MAAIMRRDRDDHNIIYMLLEHIVCFNTTALEHLRNGDEIAAVVVLRNALAVLAQIARHSSVLLEPRLASGEENQTPDYFPSSLTMVRLPPIQASYPGQDAPCAAVAICDNGAFSLLHGFESAQSVLSALTLYHTALAIHRGCYRVNGIDRIELTRSRDLYQACETSFSHVPELKSVQHILEASIGNLYAMFDCPAAA